MKIIEKRMKNRGADSIFLNLLKAQFAKFISQNARKLFPVWLSLSFNSFIIFKVKRDQILFLNQIVAYVSEYPSFPKRLNQNAWNDLIN